MPRVHVGEAGTPLQVNWKKADGSAYDLTGVTSINFVLKDPAGNETTLAGALVGVATNGVTRCVTEMDDVDATGMWEWRGTFAIGTSDVKKSDWVKMYVGD